MNLQINQNAEWFNATASQYQKRALREHDAFIAWPLYAEALRLSRRGCEVPRVLDLGSGVGISTIPFLDAGASVTAVDISDESINRLTQRAKGKLGTLTTVQSNAIDFAHTAAASGEKFDIIVCRAFLHHIPNYLALINETIPLISPNGVFIALAEPTRFDSIPRWHRAFSFLAYSMFRCFRGHLIRGLNTRYRRLRKIYRDDLAEDNVEYHAIRNGVDQDAISNLFAKSGYVCKIKQYFGTSNRIMRPIGNLLRIQTSFAIIAFRKSLSSSQP